MFLTLAEMPTDDATSQLVAPLVLSQCDEESLSDHQLADGLTIAAAHYDLPLLKLALAERRPPASARQLKVIARVAEHFARGKPGDEKLWSLLAALSAGDERKEAAAAVLAGLRRGRPARNARSRPSGGRRFCLLRRGFRPTPGGNGSCWANDGKSKAWPRWPTSWRPACWPALATRRKIPRRASPRPAS